MDSLPQVGQKNQVEIFLNALEKSIRAISVYSYASGQATLESIFDNTVAALERCFFENDQLDITIKPFEMFFEKKAVYVNKERKTSLSFALHQDGVRFMVLKKGLDRSELKEVIALLSTDFQKPEFMDEDLYCMFVERNFPHLQVMGADLLEEALEKDGSLRDQLEEFMGKSRTKCLPPQPNTPRKLRSEDLKILEEFRLNPTQFARPDEDVEKIIRALSTGREGSKKERETLERLLLMGFHFLLNDQDGEQMRVGRDLVSRIATMCLSSDLLDLFQAVVLKLGSLQKDRPDKAGEYQKVLDTVYHPDGFPLFVELLQRSGDDEVSKIISLGPPSAVRIAILLIGEKPVIGKALQEFVLKNIAQQLSWVLEEVEKDPQRSCWEQLINIMSLKPSHNFQRVLELMLGGCGSSVRLKVLKQLSALGTPEALKVFEQILKQDDSAERIVVYDLLAQSSRKTALKILRDHMDSERFKTFSVEEKEVAYSTIARIGGELSLIYFEQLWNLPGSGIFKKKAEIERRSVILKSLIRSKIPQLEQFLSKLEPATIHEELKPLIERAKASLPSRGDS